MSKWTDYIVSAAVVIGSGAAVVTLILSLIKKEPVTQNRIIEERQNLRDAVSAVYAQISALRALIRHAEAERKTTFAGAGRQISEGDALFVRYRMDRRGLDKITTELPAQDETFSDLDGEQVAIKRSAVFKIEAALKTMKEYYETELQGYARDQEKSMQLRRR
ncbi:MAG TPA: hypothetical protein VNF46_06160 [Gammaproteobacteria bacterium]|nr:hypothetical protein [Gammaproteobacteria bacterium]